MSESAPRISDEAVEELAKRKWERSADRLEAGTGVSHAGPVRWSELRESERSDLITEARGDLTAILPLHCGEPNDGKTWTIYACPDPDCEEFDTQTWTNRRASEGCAHANHPEAVRTDVMPVTSLPLSGELVEERDCAIVDAEQIKGWNEKLRQELERVTAAGKREAEGKSRALRRAKECEDKLAEVREEVEQAVLECAEGTVTGAEKAQKRLEAILDSSLSLSGGGCSTCNDGRKKILAALENGTTSTSLSGDEKEPINESYDPERGDVLLALSDGFAGPPKGTTVAVDAIFRGGSKWTSINVTDCQGGRWSLTPQKANGRFVLWSRGLFDHLLQTGNSGDVEERGEEVLGKLQAGYSLCHPEDDCEGQRAWLRAAGERDRLAELVKEAPDYLRGLASESRMEAEGGGGKLPADQQQALRGKAEGYDDAAEYLETNLASTQQSSTTGNSLSGEPGDRGDFKELGTDGHRVVLEFDGGGSPSLRLLHPESGCVTATQCGLCGRRVDDPESKPCYDCKDGFDPHCWLTDWFDNLGADELLHGKVTVAVDTEWDQDHPKVTIVGPDLGNLTQPKDTHLSVEGCDKPTKILTEGEWEGQRVGVMSDGYCVGHRLEPVDHYGQPTEFLMCSECQGTAFKPAALHLSGDGERLEKIARKIDAAIEDGWIADFNDDEIAFLRDLATRLSPENSSGVEEGCKIDGGGPCSDAPDCGCGRKEKP